MFLRNFITVCFVFFALVVFLEPCAQADPLKPRLISPDGRYEMSGQSGSDNKGTLTVRDRHRGTELLSVKDHSKYLIQPIGFISNKYSAYMTQPSSNDWQVKSITIFDGRESFEIAVKGYPQIYLIPNEYSKIIIKEGHGGGAQLYSYDLETKSKRLLYSYGDDIFAVMASPNGKMAFIWPSCQLVSLDNGKILKSLEKDSVRNGAFSPDSTSIALTNSDRRIREVKLFRINDWKELWWATIPGLEEFFIHGSDGGSVSFSPSGKFLALSGSQSSNLYLYDALSGSFIRNNTINSEKEQNIFFEIRRHGGFPSKISFSSDENLVMINYNNQYTKAYSTVTGDAYNTLQFENTFLTLLKVNQLEAKLNSLGISKRIGYKQGKIGTTYVPPVENNYYNTETQYFYGDTPIKRRDKTVVTSSGYNKDVQGYTAIYEFKNNSKQNYIIDILVSATVKSSYYYVVEDHAFFSVNTANRTESSASYKPFTFSKSILLKAGESLKDQLSVGEDIPKDLIVGVSSVTPVDNLWIEQLGKALNSSFKNVTEAESLRALVDQYLLDEKAAPWKEKLTEQKNKVVAYLDTIEQTQLKRLVSISVSMASDYDPDFENTVKVAVTNNSAKACNVAFSVGDGKSYQVGVDGKSTKETEVKVMNVSKTKVKGEINRVSSPEAEAKAKVGEDAKEAEASKRKNSSLIAKTEGEAKTTNKLTTNSGSKGAETITLKSNVGTVSFNHWKHQTTTNCAACHLGTPGAMQNFGRDFAHKTCKGCHSERNLGPTNCKGCHKK